jgi:signal transduction histidine kinase
LLAIEIKQLKADFPNSVADMPSRIDVVLKQHLGILTDVKVSAHELHSPRLEYLEIAGVMKSFCKEFGERRKVQVDYRSHDLPNHVPPDISLCLFRVLQEALHNAVKHSGVQQFNAHLWGTVEEIHLTISDCGLGFNLETAMQARGLGLNRMQERLKLVKGSLSLDSQPRRGTTIHARAPLSSGSDSVRATG